LSPAREDRPGAEIASQALETANKVSWSVPISDTLATARLAMQLENVS